MWPKGIDVRLAPARVDDAKAWLLDPQWHFKEPIDPSFMFVAVFRDLGQECFVLVSVFLSLITVPVAQA